MDGGSTIPCPRCRKHVGIEARTGALVEHSGQVRRSKKRRAKEWERVCAASGVVVAIVVAGGAFRLRDRHEIPNEIDIKLGLPGDHRPTRGSYPTQTSGSVRAVGGGLPSLGRRRK